MVVGVATAVDTDIVDAVAKGKRQIKSGHFLCTSRVACGHV